MCNHAKRINLVEGGHTDTKEGSDWRLRVG